MMLNPVACGKSIIAEIASFEPQYKSVLGMGMVFLADGVENFHAITMVSAVLVLTGMLACYSLAIYLGIVDLRGMKASLRAKPSQRWARFFPIVTIAVAGGSILILVLQGLMTWGVYEAIYAGPN